jgi:hypothetical protein
MNTRELTTDQKDLLTKAAPHMFNALIFQQIANRLRDKSIGMRPIPGQDLDEYHNQLMIAMSDRFLAEANARRAVDQAIELVVGPEPDQL